MIRKLTLLLCTTAAALSTHGESTSHEFNYGLAFSKMKQGESFKDASYSGIFGAYQLNAPDMVFVDAGLEVLAGKVEAKEKDAQSPEKLGSGFSKLHVGVGYTFGVQGTKISPFIARMSMAEKNRAKVRYVGDMDGDRVVLYEEKWDLDWYTGATSIGAQVDIDLGLFSIVPKLAVARTDGGEMSRSINTTSKTWSTKNTTFFDASLATRYKLSEGFGLYGALTYNDLTLDSKETGKQKFGATELRLGAMHAF